MAPEKGVHASGPHLDYALGKAGENHAVIRDGDDRPSKASSAASKHDMAPVRWAVSSAVSRG